MSGLTEYNEVTIVNSIASRLWIRSSPIDFSFKVNRMQGGVMLRQDIVVDLNIVELPTTKSRVEFIGKQLAMHFNPQEIDALLLGFRVHQLNADSEASSLPKAL